MMFIQLFNWFTAKSRSYEKKKKKWHWIFLQQSWVDKLIWLACLVNYPTGVEAIDCSKRVKIWSRQWVDLFTIKLEQLITKRHVLQCLHDESMSPCEIWKALDQTISKTWSSDIFILTRTQSRVRIHKLNHHQSMQIN